MCLGQPLVYHAKKPSNSWKDLKAELEGMIINETLWRIVAETEVNGSDYHECYLELSGGIERRLEWFSGKSRELF